LSEKQTLSQEILLVLIIARSIIDDHKKNHLNNVFHKQSIISDILLSINSESYYGIYCGIISNTEGLSR